jgi:rubredoxin-NAD+ reductase
MHTVVIGSGIAGWTVVRELRRLQTDAQANPITLICSDAGDFYSKPMLSNALASQKTAATLIMTPMAKLAEQTKTTVKANTQVLSIDMQARTVDTSGGVVGYDSLVLGLGADPIRLPIGGNAANEMLSVNDLGDYARFRESLPEKANITILGAGLIGCEFANDLSGAGHQVRVYDIGQWPLGRLLPEAAGRYSQQKLESAGVIFEFGNSISAIDRSESGYALTDTQGSQHQADLVLSAIGLRPRTQLAQAAGLLIDRGIRVDRQGRTSEPSVYALGDCAQYGDAGLLLPYIQPVMTAGRAIAANIAGTATDIRMPAMPVLVKTPACPTVIAPPAAGASGQWVCETTEDGLRALFRAADGSLLGMALLGGATTERQALAAQLPAVWA